MAKESRVLEDLIELLECFREGTLPTREIDIEEIYSKCEINDIIKYHSETFPYGVTRYNGEIKS